MRRLSAAFLGLGALRVRLLPRRRRHHDDPPAVLPDATRGRGVGFLMTVGTLGEVVGSLLLPVLVEPLGIAILGPASLILARRRLSSAAALIGGHATRAPTAAEETLLRVARTRSSPGRRADARAAAQPSPDDPRRRRPGRSSTRASPRIASISSRRHRSPSRQRDADGRGRPAGRTLGPDTFFGELGLLSGAGRDARRSPRSTDGTLLSLDGPDFLDLVGGGAAIRAPAPRPLFVGGGRGRAAEAGRRRATVSRRRLATGAPTTWTSTSGSRSSIRSTSGRSRSRRRPLTSRCGTTTWVARRSRRDRGERRRAVVGRLDPDDLRPEVDRVVDAPPGGRAAGRTAARRRSGSRRRPPTNAARGARPRASPPAGSPGRTPGCRRPGRATRSVTSGSSRPASAPSSWPSTRRATSRSDELPERRQVPLGEELARARSAVRSGG